MQAITAKATLVMDDMRQHNPTAAGAVDISTIVGIITDILGALKICGNTPAQAVTVLTDPSKEPRLNRMIRRRVRQQHLVGPIQQSTLRVAKTITAHDVTAMYSEVDNHPTLDFVADTDAI